MPDYEYDGDDLMGDPPPARPPAETGDDSGGSAGGAEPVEGASTESAAPPLRQPARAATPPAGGAGAQQQATGEATQPAPAALPQELLSALAQERLTPLAGETTESAWSRLHAHIRGRANRAYNDFLTQRQANERALEEMRQFRSAMEPVARQLWQQQQAAQREQAMSVIPDPETDREAHNTWLLQQTARLLLERDQRDQQAAEEARQENERLVRTDAAITEAETDQDQLEQLVAADPEFATAVRIATAALTKGFSVRLPNASPDEIDALVAGAWGVEAQNARRAGIPLRDAILGGHREMLALYRDALSAATAEAAPAPAVNGNGQGQPQPKPARSAPASPTAQRIARTQAQQAARQVVSPTPPAAAPSGDGIDFANLSEDDYVDLFLSSPAMAKQLTGQFRDRHGKHSWRGMD